MTFSHSSQGCEIHVGGDVLAADTSEGLCVQGVKVVAGQGAGGSGGGVEVSGGVAVVDCEDVAGLEGLGKGAGEGVDAQVYFCELEGSSMIWARVSSSMPT